MQHLYFKPRKQTRHTLQHFIVLLLLLLQLALQPTVGFGLLNNILPFFFYPSPTFYIFSLPALEDLLLLPLSIFSWVFPFVLSLPVLEWRSFWASYPPPFSLGDVNQLILRSFIHFTIFSPLLISSSSRFVQLFYSLFTYLGPYILRNIFLSIISIASCSFFINFHASAPYNTTGLISFLYNIILVALDKSRLLKGLTAAK